MYEWVLGREQLKMRGKRVKVQESLRVNRKRGNDQKI